MNTLQQKYDVIWHKASLCESIAAAEILWLHWRRGHPIENNPCQKESKSGHKVWSLSPSPLLTDNSWLIQLFSLKLLIAAPSLPHAVPSSADCLTVPNIIRLPPFLLGTIYLVEEYLTLQNNPADFSAIEGVRSLWM